MPSGNPGSILGYAPRILVVDDEPAVRALFDHLLSEDGYLVSAVGTAREALQALSDTTYELALIDLSLPDADGLEVVRQIRSEFPELIILAASGFMVGSVPAKAIAAGATATLRKPMKPRRLRDAVYLLLDPFGGCFGLEPANSSAP
jgi:two-component system KDP operon response regulator KdpE